MDTGNLYKNGDGRECRECSLIRSRAWKKKKNKEKK